MTAPGPARHDDQKIFSIKRFTMLFTLFSLLILTGTLILYAQRSGVVQQSLYEGSRALLEMQKKQDAFEIVEDIQRKYDSNSGAPRQTMFIDLLSSKVTYNTNGTANGYPDKQGVLMRKEHPDVWAAMSASQGPGMFLSHSGLYVFDNAAALHGEIHGPNKIAVFISTDTLASEYMKVQQSFLLPFFILLALAGLASWRLARVKPREP